MRTGFTFVFIALGGLFSAVIPVSAHHGTAIYDPTKITTVVGTVSDFQFVNPHVLIYVDVKDESGKVEKWVAEGMSPNMLVRQGWNKNTLKPGDRVTAEGHRSRTGSNLMMIEKLVLSNGREIFPVLQ
jgi:hypothetical protein